MLSKSQASSKHSIGILEGQECPALLRPRLSTLLFLLVLGWGQ